ncbi:hypothetical protein BDR26DRAFT_859900 [Obelidium mucronatum]|nr:hypothetical protein BDR26DRAFT_859900 [Obelidium mucronatum]
MLSVTDIYQEHPNETPSKPSSHRFLLIKNEAIRREVKEEDCLQKELYVHQDKSINGIFLSAKDAEYLSLKEIGTVDTLYGIVKRYSPLHISFLSHTHSLPVDNIFQLPPSFENTELYGDGIIGINVLFTLGVSVAYDRGFIYLIRNGLEPLISGADKPTDDKRIVHVNTSDLAVAASIAGLGIYEDEEEGTYDDEDFDSDD